MLVFGTALSFYINEQQAMKTFTFQITPSIKNNTIS